MANSGYESATLRASDEWTSAPAAQTLLAERNGRCPPPIKTGRAWIIYNRARSYPPFPCASPRRPMSYSWPTTTPRLSPTTSIESTDSLVTPNRSTTSTFADDYAVSEDVLDAHGVPFKSASEVWEEFDGVACDPLAIPVADAGIPASPSSSLLSGIDLLGDTAPPPLPEAPATSTRLESKMARPRRISLFDFPSPPIPVPNRRMTLQGVPGSGSINGSPLMVSLPGTFHKCPPQPISRSPSSVLRRWSTLPPTASHPGKRRGSNELVTSKSTDSFRTRAVTDPPMVPSVPFVTISSFLPGDSWCDGPPPVRRSRRQEPSDTFTSFMDMSINESTLSKSRVYNFFSKVSGRLKLRRKHH